MATIARLHHEQSLIWEERFGSVVVEEEERALRTMAAYIDLNPVRAGMVLNPADYRWSGYAEAMAGKARAPSPHPGRVGVNIEAIRPDKSAERDACRMGVINRKAAGSTDGGDEGNAGSMGFLHQLEGDPAAEQEDAMEKRELIR